LGVLDLGAGLEKPFNQNHQTLQSMRSLGWTFEDNTVDSLFVCATLTGREESIPHLVQAGVEISDTGAKAVKSDPGCCVEWAFAKMGA